MKNNFYVFQRLVFLQILVCFVVCNTASQSADSPRVPGTRDRHGSRFEIFVSHLKSLPEPVRDSAVLRFIADFPVTPLIEHDSVVSLYWYGKAARVLIDGDLQLGWTGSDQMQVVPCGTKNFFYQTYTIPVDSRLDYQFKLDTTVTTDPRNPAITPSGYGPHSEIAMPGFRPDLVRMFRPAVPHGTIDSMVVSSRDTTIRSRKVKIYVPPGYASLSRLPVLFVMDGLEAMDYNAYPIVMDNLIADRKIQPALVVFIPPGDRFAEYLGANDLQFINAICDEFVPLIDRKYKTDPVPAKRGIAGISAGGHLALLSLFTRPDVFQCGAGQSPAISEQLYKALRSFPEKEKTRPSLCIYMDVGRYDLGSGNAKNLTFFQACTAFHLEMQKAGLNHVFQAFNDGHEWANWRERTDDILVCFFGTNK